MSLDQIPIGRFAMMTRLSQKALRLYDKRDILIPQAKDQITGYRYYTVSQIERGMRIKMLSWMGFGLEEISNLLAAMDNGDEELIAHSLQKRLTDTHLEIVRLREIEDILLNRPQSIEILYMRTTKPVLKESPRLRVISARKKGTYGQTIGELIGILMSAINHPDNRNNFIKITGPIMFIDHDEGYTPVNADIEVAIPISGRISLELDEIEIKNIPGSKIVSILYTGPYEEIGLAYQQIIQYILEKGYHTIGNCRELYLNSPGEVSPENLITELQYPIETGD